jgi:uncharacterized protein YjbI with pentapeptide repeats
MAKTPALAAPRIARIVLPELTPADGTGLSAHASHDALRIDGADLDGADLSDMSFTECALHDVSASHTTLRGARFVDTTIERLDAAVFTAPRSHLRDVEIVRSRLGSAELYGSGWQSVHFIGCKLGFVNLRGAELRDVLFTDCTIDELDLGQARATRVAFRSTRVKTLDVTGATLTHVDLRALELEQIVGLEGLKGATLSSFQVGQLAALFAERLGIRVQD